MFHISFFQEHPAVSRALSSKDFPLPPVKNEQMEKQVRKINGKGKYILQAKYTSNARGHTHSPITLDAMG